MCLVPSADTPDRRSGGRKACEDPRSTCHTSHTSPLPFLGKLENMQKTFSEVVCSSYVCR